MISVIVPAHDEASVIGASLASYIAAAGGLAVEVLVVCNGCSDNTAAVAGAFAGVVPAVRVLESAVASKVGAVNLGLSEARGDVVVCVDADVRLGGAGLAGLVRELSKPGVLAAAPKAVMDFGGGTPWFVRAYYKLWLELPYVREGMVGCGVYALNAGGRARVGALPNIISDDGYVRFQFNSAERVLAEDVTAIVRAPRSVMGLIRIKTRSRLGRLQLRALFGHAMAGAQRSGGAFGVLWPFLMVRPRLWPCVVPYLIVTLVTRWRAGRQFSRLAEYVWERDLSTRVAATASDVGTPGSKRHG